MSLDGSTEPNIKSILENPEILPGGELVWALSIDQIAQIAHEVNRAYCKATGDNSQMPWEEAPDWQIASAINGVMFHKNNPHRQATTTG
jgi:hypothetical protein